MNKSGTLLIIFVMFALLNSGIVRADVPDFHKPIPCIGCHQETLDASAGPGECGNCHNYKLPDGSINVPLMQEQHNPKICRACHIGNTAVDASDRDILHNAHNTVQCSQCHVAGNTTDGNSTIIGIEEGKAFQCTSCHGSQIHSIHIKNLDKACSICHGSWAAGKIYSGDNVSSSQAKSLENPDLERFTIFSLIKTMFNALLGFR